MSSLENAWCPEQAGEDMKLRMRIVAAVMAAMMIGSATTAAASAASASSASMNVYDQAAQGGIAVVGLDGQERSISPDPVNTTHVRGLSANLKIQDTDRVVLQNDGRTFLLKDEAGNVLLSSVDPLIDVANRSQEGKFVVVGDRLVLTPVSDSANKNTFELRIGGRAACWSSFAGQMIFNVGMTGVCAGIGVGTAGIGAAICGVAAATASSSINWDKQCR